MSATSATGDSVFHKRGVVLREGARCEELGCDPGSEGDACHVWDVRYTLRVDKALGRTEQGCGGSSITSLRLSGSTLGRPGQLTKRGSAD